MKKSAFILILLLIFGLASFAPAPIASVASDDRFLTHIVDLQKNELQFYWKNEDGEILRSIGNLKKYIEDKGQSLLFAANAGMYKADNAPLGLYIENGKTLAPLNKYDGNGNFYLKPNGIFYITEDNKPFIVKTDNFKDNPIIKFATQSGPMLIIDGEIHPAFTEGSANVHIRNGVGILPDNKVLFVMSKEPVNFYDFASFFKSMGCRNALYLDGAVSQTYLPSQNWEQTGGNFGVMIGVTK